MKEDKLDFEKTIVAEAVSDISAKRYASNQSKNSSSEWVTAANAKVKAQSHSPSNKSPDKQRGADANRVPSNTGNKKSRDVLSEFSRVDSYTREKNINFNAINEQDTELMTASRRSISRLKLFHFHSGGIYSDLSHTKSNLSKLVSVNCPSNTYQAFRA